MSRTLGICALSAEETWIKYIALLLKNIDESDVFFSIYTFNKRLANEKTLYYDD